MNADIPLALTISDEGLAQLQKDIGIMNTLLKEQCEFYNRITSALITASVRRETS
jgi:hypothetical protein